jgi:hypothetical protein
MKSTMIRTMLATLVLAVAAISSGCTSCSNTSWKSETGNPNQDNRKLWKTFLKVTKADPSKPLGTTMSHISNVSHKMAVAKMNQAMQSYSDELGYKLSTVFEVAMIDESEQNKDKNKETSHGQPAIAAMVVGNPGHL